MPITDGSTPATAELTMRASTGSLLARFIDAHQQDRRGAVVQRRGIPGGDAAVSRAKRRAQLGQLLLAGLRARLLIVSHESRRLLALRDADRNDLLTKAPGGDSGRRFALGAGGEGVPRSRLMSKASARFSAVMPMW